MNRFSLEGKVAIVTGASSGLGVAFPLGLAETAAAVKETGQAVVAVRTDVTKIEDCDALVTAATNTFGRVDVLVNNAGTGGQYFPCTEDPPEHFRSVVDLNLHAAYWMAQACGRVMGAGSSVINISSVMAVT